MSPLRDHRRFLVEFLSPVHTGTGCSLAQAEYRLDGETFHRQGEALDHDRVEPACPPQGQSIPRSDSSQNPTSRGLRDIENLQKPPSRGAKPERADSRGLRDIENSQNPPSRGAKPERADSRPLRDIENSQNAPSRDAEPVRTGTRPLRDIEKYRLSAKLLTAPSGEPLYEQAKDAQGRPMLPGTAIKGALLSALGGFLAESAQDPDDGRQDDDETAPPHSATHPSPHMFGKAADGRPDPHYRITRALSVGDATGDLESLHLIQVATCRLAFKAADKPGCYFKSGSRRTTNRLAEAESVYCEAFQAGSRLPLSISRDRFLLESDGPAAKLTARLRFPQEAKAALEWHNLARVCNYVADRELAEDSHFFARAGLTGLVRWCEDLRANIPGDDREDFVLRVGRFIGYRGLTGNAASFEALCQADVPRPDHRDWKRFPITRRVLVSASDRRFPTALPGWVLLCRDDAPTFEARR